MLTSAEMPLLADQEDIAQMGDVVSAAFSEEHAERLTGVSKSQLRYWNRIRFFTPSFNGQEWDSSIGRVYSFGDIVSLRVLGVLRNQYNVSLQHLRQVSEKLAHLARDRWTGVKLYVLKQRVVWVEPGTERPQEIISGQFIMPTIQLEVVVADTKRDIEKLNNRGEQHFGQVAKSRAVNHNAPVISGTRIRVSAIQRYHRAGYSPSQILEEYPDLTDEDIRAAIEYPLARAAA